MFGCGSKSSESKPTTSTSDPSKIAINVTEAGFEPASVTVKKGVATTLVFTRKTEKTCAKEVVLHVTKADTIKKDLPLDTPVEIAATFPEAGKLDYACGMNMVTGVITVQ